MQPILQKLQRERHRLVRISDPANVLSDRLTKYYFLNSIRSCVHAPFVILLALLCGPWIAGAWRQLFGSTLNVSILNQSRSYILTLSLSYRSHAWAMKNGDHVRVALFNNFDWWQYVSGVDSNCRGRSNAAPATVKVK